MNTRWRQHIRSVPLLIGMSVWSMITPSAHGQSCSSTYVQTCALATTGTRGQVGDWGPLFGPFFPPAIDPSWPSPNEHNTPRPFPMHAILLKTGKVLILPVTGRGGLDVPASFTVMVFDPSDNMQNWTDADFQKREFQIPLLDEQHIPPIRTHLIPCAGHAALPDGRILFVGGEGDHPVAAETTILDPNRISFDLDGTVHCNNCWIPQDQIPNIPNLDGICPYTPTIKNARYYPTVTTLGDGRSLVMGGASSGDTCQLVNSEGTNTPMIFDWTKAPGQQPQQQWTTLPGGRGCPGPGGAFSDVCETHWNCAKRCQGGQNHGAVCTINANCPGGSCVSQTQSDCVCGSTT